MTGHIAITGDFEQVDRGTGKFQRILTPVQPDHSTVETVMPRHILGDAKLPANPVMHVLQHPRRRQRSRRRHRDLIKNRGHNQCHEGPGDAVPGAVEKHQVIDIADALHPVEISPDKILWLPDGAGLAKMIADPVCRRQKATLDGACIGDRVAEIAVCLGELPFLFLDRADIDTDAAIAKEGVLIIKHRHAAETDMDRSAIPAFQLIFEAAEFPPRREIGKMACKGVLAVCSDRNLVAALADHHPTVKAGDLEEPV